VTSLARSHATSLVQSTSVTHCTLRYYMLPGAALFIYRAFHPRHSVSNTMRTHSAHSVSAIALHPRSATLGGPAVPVTAHSLHDSPHPSVHRARQRVPTHVDALPPHRMPLRASSTYGASLPCHLAATTARKRIALPPFDDCLVAQRSCKCMLLRACWWRVSCVTQVQHTAPSPPRKQLRASASARPASHRAHSCLFAGALLPIAGAARLLFGGALLPSCRHERERV